MLKRTVCLLLCLIMALACVPACGEGAAPADGWVEAFLSEQAGAQKDVWVKAVLEAGAKDISWEGTTASFSLRSFDPDLKTNGSYANAADKAAWTETALKNIAGYNLRVSVEFEQDGTVKKKPRNAFLDKVKAAAKTAKSAFDKKELTQAFTDMLFRVPATDKKKPSAADLMVADGDFAAFIAARPELFPCENPSEWAPLLYLQRAWKYSSAKTGPHSITLSWDALDPVTFLNRAFDGVSSTLAGVTADQRPKEDSLSYMWRSGLAETAVEAKKGRLKTQKITFDIDELIAGELPSGYVNYFAAYKPAEWYDKLVEGYRALPAEASQPMPKTGVLFSLNKKGRTVTVKVPKGGRNTYVILRDADTGVIQAEAFIEPEKNVNMKVTEGVYIVQYATGSTWYGTEGAFGPLGTYTASDEFIIAKNKWTLTSEREQPGISLHPIKKEDLGAIEDKSVHVEGTTEPTIRLKGNYPAVRAGEEGVSPYTGLAASGEPLTPIVMVLDNAEEAYPHWGVRYADIIFQVPNAGQGATKLLALFADSYPHQAGPVRSGRVSMLPSALMFNAAFAFAGPPAVKGGQVDLEEMVREFRMSQTHRVYNLLNNNGFGERFSGLGKGGHNLSCHIDEIHRNLIDQGVEFEERPFLFTDEPRTKGAAANIVRVLHRGDDAKSGSNSASRAVFKYDAEKNAYTRTNSSGLYTDRDTGETIYFSNVVVIRTRFSYEKNYIYLFKHLVGSGAAEIFQNGKYVRGAWVRNSTDGRLILVDENGDELKMQRGKSFFVLTNDVSDVIYSE